MKNCKCGHEAKVKLSFRKPKVGQFTTAPLCMRCADKEAFAVLSRGVWFVKGSHYKV